MITVVAETSTTSTTAASAVGAFHVEDGRSSSEQNVCDSKLLPLAGIDVSVYEFGRNLEEIPRTQLDGLLTFRPKLQSQTSGDEKPIEVSFAVVVPVRHDPAAHS